MLRPIQRAIVTLGCLAATLPLSSCAFLETFFAPCPVERNIGGFAEDKKLLDGSWSLQTIDGNPIPAGGYRLPLDSKNPLAPPTFLRYGSMSLITTETYHADDCGELKESGGLIRFNYETTSAASANPQYKQYTGRFSRDHDANKTTIGADKYTLPVAVTGTPFPTALTATASIGFGPLSLTYVLAFTRDR